MGDSPWLGVYRTLLAARLKSQLTYRTSFGLDVFGSIMVEATDFAEIYVIFHNVPTLGGLDIASAFLVFGLGTLGFALANAVFGELDTMPTFIRTGTLEVMLLRPLPLLAQIVTGDLRLKRLGGAAVGVVILGASLVTADVRWTPTTTRPAPHQPAVRRGHFRGTVPGRRGGTVLAHRRQGYHQQLHVR